MTQSWENRGRQKVMPKAALKGYIGIILALKEGKEKSTCKGSLGKGTINKMARI